MSARNVEIVRSAHESWNRRDYAAIVRNFADRFVYVDHARNLTLNGAEEFRVWVEAWARAIPDGRIIEAQYIDAGDTVIAQFTAEGTNDGPLGPFPATGNRLSLQFCEIVKCDQDGRTLSGGVYYDQYTLFTQLGHIKPLAEAA